MKIDLTGEDDDDELMQDDDDVTMKSPEQEPQPEEENDDQASKKGDINDERRDFREQDEVDKFLNEEGKPTDENDDEEIEVDEINIEEYEAGEAHDAVIEYPKWMKRVEFGSKVLPIEPCTIGDAQPELIKILLLQIGLHIVRIYRLFQRNFCGDIETAWKHFQQNQKFRMDLDSRVPYLGEDENGELIEPTAQQMKELYQEIGRPQQKDDIGEEGFVNAYYGAVVLKRLLVYTLECGYTYEDLQNIFYDEEMEKLSKRDTTRDEMRKTTAAREALDRQDVLVRRIIAGAYRVNAVYFFRNVDFQDTITLNPVDIVCALRPPLRRISVLHLILQNGRQLPRPLLQNCMMQSMTTTTSSSGMINDQDGASTCQKLTYLRLLIPRFLPIVNVLTRPLANRKQPRRQHQHWAECQKRKHHRQQHGEPSKPLLRQNKLQ